MDSAGFWGDPQGFDPTTIITLSTYRAYLLLPMVTTPQSTQHLGIVICVNGLEPLLGTHVLQGKCGT